MSSFSKYHELDAVVFLCWQEKQNQKITSCIIASLPDSRHPVPQQVDPDLLPQSVF